MAPIRLTKVTSQLLTNVQVNVEVSLSSSSMETTNMVERSATMGSANVFVNTRLKICIAKAIFKIMALHCMVFLVSPTNIIF